MTLDRAPEDILHEEQEKYSEMPGTLGEGRANVSTHNHPQTIRDNGLQDGCPRCRELADRPFSYLDDGNMESLIDRVADGAEPRSVNEDNAIRAVGRVMLQANTLWRLGWRPRS